MHHDDASRKLIYLLKETSEGYGVTFLITNFHTEQMYRHILVDFVIFFVEDMGREVSGMKLSMLATCVTATEELFMNLQNIWLNPVTFLFLFPNASLKLSYYSGVLFLVVCYRCCLFVFCLFVYLVVFQV
uniref:Uncharacterized protein n=1 Tax=Theropithecus gelada TaxID=9565 RepID=A0A8D2DZY7_THEGE